MGSEIVAKSLPDGYTIMIHSATHVANPYLYKKLPYDTLKDFVAIAPVSVLIGMLVVHPSMPVKTAKDLIALAKSRPGKIVYASSGIGTFPHLAMALLDASANTRTVHVAYKGGGPAATAIGSGEAHTMVATIASVRPQIEAKRVRPIAVTSNYRISLYPTIPTIAESGVPGYEFTAWVGVLAPAGIPKPIVEKLNAELQRILRAPEVGEKLRAEALEPMFMTEDQFAQRLHSDYKRYGKVIKAAGATVD